MASPTLAQYVARNPNEKVQSIAFDITDDDMLFEVLPFDGTPSQSVEWNEIDTLGGIAQGDGNFSAQTADSRAATTTAAKSATLQEIFGQIQLGALMQRNATELRRQIAGKSQNMSKNFITQFVSDGTTANYFKGLAHADTIPTSQYIGTNGTATDFSLELLDELCDECNRDPDYLMMSAPHVRVLRKLIRAQGGSDGMEARTLPSGRRANVLTYNGAIVLRNNSIPEQDISGTDTRNIYALNMDRGDRVSGLMGINSENQAGITVIPGGASENNSGSFWNVVWLTCIANFNQKSCAGAYDVKYTTS